MDSLLNYDLAMQRIKEWQREAEIYRLSTPKVSYRDRLMQEIDNLRVRLTPKARRQTGPSL